MTTRTDRTGAYQAGGCNIGPAEIRLRRRSAHVAALVTLVLLAVLLLLRADPAWRLVLAVPATMAAAGYLQAALRFCAAFGLRGVFNVGDTIGDSTPVPDEKARRQDRVRSLQIGAGSVAAGIGVVLLALLI